MQPQLNITTITSAAQLSDALNTSNALPPPLLVCLKGESIFIMDGKEVCIRPNTLVFLRESNSSDTFKILKKPIHFVAINANETFLNTLNFDINVLSSINFTPGRADILRVTPNAMKMILRFIRLMEDNMKENSDPVYANSISRNLFAALIYQIMQCGAEHRDIAATDSSSGRLSQRHNYVRSFLRLLHAHFAAHRTVAFYADKLFLSPKYLSTIVKEVTGHSAADWIDHIVITQAKNLLRYSGMNIQQIAYQLNFPNQSAFGKYFKHATGLSPSEFQKS